MPDLDLDTLLTATSAGGPSCLTSVTELEPAAGPHATVTPAKFASRGRDRGVYAYEKRYLDGEWGQAVVIDGKPSAINRVEQALDLTIEEGHPLLSRLPRIEVVYDGDPPQRFTDLTLPHRYADGHVRAGSIDGVQVTQTDAYRAIRDATPADARALLDVSPTSLVFGAWDSSRASRQGRWRSCLVGEVVGFTDNGPEEDAQPLKGGARLDPVGQRVELSPAAMKALADAQKGELSRGNYDGVVKKAKGTAPVSASPLGLGGIPPSLETLGGVACKRIVRSHVLSFAALRQIRFGAGPEGDAACRALLAAYALAGLARSDSELVLRAGCDLRESGPTVVTVDQRYGEVLELAPLGIEAADALLEAALAEAEAKAGVRWDGIAMSITGNPSILAGALADEAGEQ